MKAVQTNMSYGLHVVIKSITGPKLQRYSKFITFKYSNNKLTFYAWSEKH